MDYDRSDELLSSAFAVIAKYDPALFARMSADDWSISTDYDAAFPDARPGILGMMDYEMSMNAYGTTTQANMTASGAAEVFINSDGVNGYAENCGVPRALFAADVVAHEYQHTSQIDSPGPSAEISAFRAGSAFARKLPAPYGAMIARTSDATLDNVADLY